MLAPHTHTRMTSPGVDFDLVVSSLRLPASESCSLSLSRPALCALVLAVVVALAVDTALAVMSPKPLSSIVAAPTDAYAAAASSLVLSLSSKLCGHLSDSRHMKTSAPPPIMPPALRGVVGTPCGQCVAVLAFDVFTPNAAAAGFIAFDSSSKVTIFSRGFIMICICCGGGGCPVQMSVCGGPNCSACGRPPPMPMAPPPCCMVGE